jgi:regulation of enolase protein 1 (concanavalin A-like superfamily)
MAETFRWHNEPAAWNGNADALSLKTDARTDFWQEAFYGFRRDSGHAYLRPVSGDFTGSATVTGIYETLYDQAGLMLRLNACNWIKCGIEYTDGLMHFSVVVTRDVSDWSVIPLPGLSPSAPLFVRLTRHDAAVRIQFRIDKDAPWQMARLCPFSAEDAEFGIVACSPERDGFEASFRDIAVGTPISRALHDVDHN